MKIEIKNKDRSSLYEPTTLNETEAEIIQLHLMTARIGLVRDQKEFWTEEKEIEIHVINKFLSVFKDEKSFHEVQNEKN